MIEFSPKSNTDHQPYLHFQQQYSVFSISMFSKSIRSIRIRYRWLGCRQSKLYWPNSTIRIQHNPKDDINIVFKRSNWILTNQESRIKKDSNNFVD